MKRMKPVPLLLALSLLLALLFSACSASPGSPGIETASASAATTRRPTETVINASPIARELSSAPALSSEAGLPDDDAQLKAYLDGLVASLNDVDGDTLHYYSLSEEGVFYTISMPAFDSIYDNLDSLSASDLSSARNIALDLVSGEFAEDLIAHIRANGGASKAVYITLGCSRGVCMASCDLSVFMDELKR